ncbi:MAG: GNAT family N-acetyltransferase, partial [Candidatus Thermoplasmatota archaeon]
MTATPQEARERARIAIREFRPEDYAGITDVSNLVDPDYPSTETEVREEDAMWDRKKYVQVRYVTADAGTGAIVALAEYNHMPWSFDPRRFAMWIGVRPDRQGQGIGRALYMRLLEDFRARGASALRSWVR